MGCRIATRSFWGNVSAYLSRVPCLSKPERSSLRPPVHLWYCLWPRDPVPLTFNMCNNVVFPALSSPRKRSLACLLRRPRDARTSQTIGRPDVISFCSDHSRKSRELGRKESRRLTPVDDPHLLKAFAADRGRLLRIEHWSFKA